MTRRLTLGFLVLGALALLPAEALGQPSEDSAITVGVERSALPELPDNVTARLSDEADEPISGALIEFWIEVEILGVRNALLGTATTDATGVARVPILPRRPDYQVRASFDGNDLYRRAETLARLTFPEERVEPVETVAPPGPLDTLRQVMPTVMAMVVGILWIFFALAVIYVIKTIHGHGRSVAVLPTVETE